MLGSVTAGDGPLAVGVNPLTNRVYVGKRYDDTVSVIDSRTNTVTGTVAVGPPGYVNAPVDIAVNPLTNLVYVTEQYANSLLVMSG